MRRSRILFVLMILVVVTVFLTGCERRERPWPSRAIQIVVPFAPGGESDFNVRAYATRLGPILGQSIVVQNMAGGGGVVGANHVRISPPDGYTVIQWHSGIGVSYALGTSDMLIDDFELAAIIAMPAFSVLVNTSSPFYTLEDLINASIAEPDTLMYAVGMGAPSHATGVLLNLAGAMFRIVDVGDAAMRNTSLMGGHIDAIPSALGAVRPFIESGDFRALAIIDSRRSSVATDVPTVVELGFPEAAFPYYMFLAFPRGTPREIVERFTDALEQVYQSADYRNFLLGTFEQDPFFMRGEEALNRIRAQQEEMLLLRPYF